MWSDLLCTQSFHTRTHTHTHTHILLAFLADLVVLVISATDALERQTVESIRFIQEVKVPCVLAITKSDLLEDSDVNTITNVDITEERSRTSVSDRFNNHENVHKVKSDILKFFGFECLNSACTCYTCLVVIVF